MKLFFVTFVVMAVVNMMSVTIAHAQKAGRVQKIDFEASDVDGKVRQPDGSYIVQKRGIEFIPLYKLKESFDEQIQDSVEFIK